MRSRHLTRNGTARVFQIRLPKSLDPGFQLAPIRITLGTGPNSRARRAADVLAGLAWIEFDRIGVRAMLPGPAAARQSVEQLLKRTLPILLGMDAVDGTPLSDAVRERAVEASFDALAQIGNDRAAGRGVFADDAIRFEAPFIAALRDENAARSLVGMPALPVAAPDPVPARHDPSPADGDARASRPAGVRTAGAALQPRRG